MTPAYLTLAVVTGLSAAVSLWFSTVALRTSVGEVRVLAGYVAARSIALFAVALVPLFVRLDAWLLAVAIALIVVQVLDGAAALGAGGGGWGRTLASSRAAFVAGPAITAAVQGAALAWFLNGG